VRCYNACHAKVVSCTIQYNNAGSKGAGIFAAYSSLWIENNRIMENEAHTGAGIWCGWAKDGAVVKGNLISGNRATKGVAGGLGFDACEITITNNLIIKNRALNAGGIYAAWSSPVILNNTIADNEADSIGGGLWCLSGKAKVTNCIIWNNQAPQDPQIHVLNAKPVITCCDVEGGFAGQGNIDEDPLFVDPMVHDYHIVFISPCRDGGDGSAPHLPDTDFEGDPRIAFDGVDMGADEFHPHLYYTGEAAPGGSVEVKITGEPFSAPLLFWVGGGLLDPPLPTAWGDWYLTFPLLFEAVLEPIPENGIALLPYTFAPDFPAPWLIVMQALVGDVLTNSCEMSIQ
jgi:hypothetical protein